jgi:UDP-glucose 4-epimerase
MRVLVTGGAGFIGSIAVSKLIQNNYKVTVLDDLSSGHIENIPSEVDFVSGSILESKDVSVALKGVSAVLHFAGKSLVGESVENPDLYQNVNVEGSKILLSQMREKNVKKIVFSSSASIYGQVNSTPINETCIAKPTNPYGSTKLQIENLISKECSEHGVSAISLRYFNVVGGLKTSNGWLAERHAKETHLVPNILKSSQEFPINIFGTDWPTKDGTCIRDYVHVIDLIDAHLLALNKLNKPGHDIFNLGGGVGYSVREVLSAAQLSLEREIPVLESERRAGDPSVLVADISKAKEGLNWVPTRGINQMVQDAYDSLNWVSTNLA